MTISTIPGIIWADIGFGHGLRGCRWQCRAFLWTHVVYLYLYLVASGRMRGRKSVTVTVAVWSRGQHGKSSMKHDEARAWPSLAENNRGFWSDICSSLVHHAPKSMESIFNYQSCSLWPFPRALQILGGVPESLHGHDPSTFTAGSRSFFRATWGTAWPFIGRFAGDVAALAGHMISYGAPQDGGMCISTSCCMFCSFLVYHHVSKYFCIHVCHWETQLAFYMSARRFGWALYSDRKSVV